MEIETVRDVSTKPKFCSVRTVDSGDSLIPKQQNVTLNQKTALAFHEQRMIKYPFIANFHKQAEYLHAGLLEGNPNVRSYVPKPYRLKVDGHYYTPDIFYASTDGNFVGELSPMEKFSDDWKRELEVFFAKHDTHFIVISIESVTERIIEAQNWLMIVRHLVTGQVLDTTNEEADVYSRIIANGSLRIGDIVDAGDRTATEMEELATYRLLYHHRIKANLTSKFIDYDMDVEPCF